MSSEEDTECVAGSLMEAVEREFQSSGLMQGRYFAALAADDAALNAFHTSQAQFSFAVAYFSRPMAALTARMPVSALRVGLVHNLAEEHGWDEETPGGFTPSLAHDRTFGAFLELVGFPAEKLATVRAGAVVRAFNCALMGACQMEPVETAFGAMGAIEHAFADVSAFIGRRVVELGWVSGERLVHYKLHAEIDKRHAADFFRVVEPAWLGGGEGAARVLDGLRLGNHLFHQLYEGLAP